LLDLDFNKSPTAEFAIKDPCLMLFEDERWFIQITCPTDNNNNYGNFNEGNSDEEQNVITIFNNKNHNNYAYNNCEIRILKM